jgi:hypothetical protein
MVKAEDYIGKDVSHVRYWITGNVIRTKTGENLLGMKLSLRLVVKWDSGATTEESPNDLRFVLPSR